MPLNKNKKFYYPWRDNNAFQLLVDGENYFSRIFNLIDEASHYIIIEQYLIESGNIVTRLTDHLINAAQRNVTVLLLFDAYGSLNLNKNDRDRLNKKNIHLIFYNPLHLRNGYKNLIRNHRKFFCVDNYIALTGGAGFTDEFDTKNNSNGWHDVMLQISGPVLNDWLNSFTDIWLPYAALPVKLMPDTLSQITKENIAGRLVISNSPQHQEISRSLINQIQHSQDAVWLATPYFIATRKLRRELKYAALRGVDVRLLLPNTHSDHPWVTYAYRNYYHKLLRSGVRIFEYQTRFLHAKLIICDDWISIGSSNLDRWNRRWSTDTNQEIKSIVFSEKIMRFFENDFSQSHEIIADEWKRRSWSQRLKEVLCQKIVFLLDMIGSTYRK